MSHNRPSQPLDSRTVFADPLSTSQTENGSQEHPYKTLQAALDAIPTPGDAGEALLPWVVNLKGIFDEDIDFPSKGHVHLLGDSGATILTGNTITWDAEAPTYAETSTLIFSRVRCVSDITITAVAGVTLHLELQDSQLANVTASGVTDAGTTTFEASFSQVGDINFNGSMSAHNTDFEDVTTSKVLSLESVTANSLTSTDATQDATLRKFRSAGDVTCTGYIKAFDQGLVSGNLTVGGSVSNPCRITNTLVIGTSSFGDVGVIALCSFTGTFTVTGGSSSTQIFLSNFAALSTINGGNTLDITVGCSFASLTVNVIPTRGFFTTSITGTFTGPSGSFKVGDSSKGMNVPTLAGGATEDLVSVASGGGGSSFFQEAIVTLTGGNAVGSMGVLNSNPVEVLPAPGAGKTYIFSGAEFKFTPGSVAYDNAGASGGFNLNWEGTFDNAISGPFSFGFSDGALPDPPQSQFSTVGGGVPLYENTAVNLKTDGDYYDTEGNGTLSVRVIYAEVSTL